MRYHTVREAAEALGVSASAVHKAIERGRLTATLADGPTGRTYVIADAHLQAYALAHDRQGVTAYNRVASGDVVDDTALAQAQEYAKRRHRRWPPHGR